jgi:hypothetical protein
VVEVEHLGVGFATVHARMTEEIIAHTTLERCRGTETSQSHVRDVPFLVSQIPFVGVLPLAQKADPLSRLALK